MTGWQRGSGRWSRRAGVMVTVVAIWLTVLVPDASAAPLKPPSFSLSSLVSWLTSGSWPVTGPPQRTGRWPGGTGEVPASATRAGGGTGTAPGKGAGQMPPYQPFRPGGGAVMTGVAATGFVPGKSVPLGNLSSASVRVYRNPDGSTTVREYSGTVNYQASPGDWQPIDAALTPAANGGYHERSNSLRVSLASSASSPELAGMGEPGGASFSFGLAGAAPVTGSVSGADASFAGALPATDVLETATGTGLKEALVLRSAAAPSAFTFPLKLNGLTAVANPDGSVSLDDAAGQVTVSIPAAVVTDARRDRKSDLPVAQLTLPWQVVPYQGGQALSVSLPAGWLSDPSRAFPVTVDPSTINWSMSGTTYVQNATSGNLSGSVLLHMGTWDGGADVARSLFLPSDFASGGLTNYHITSASMNIWDAWAYTCGTSEPVDVEAITSPWSLTTVGWPGPSRGAPLGQWFGLPPAAACTNYSGNPGVGGWITVPLNGSGLSLLNSWSLGTAPSYGLAVVADNEANSYQWKQLVGRASPVNQPYLSLTYTPDVPPRVDAVYPPANAAAGSLTPHLIATGFDPDAWPDPLTYQFVVCGDATLHTCTGGNTSGVVATSTPGGANSTGAGWISSSEWVVPSGALKWSQPYYWFVQNYDGVDIGSSSESEFTTNIPQPEVTSYSANGDAQGINPGSSSYTLSATDARIAGVGAALSIGRAYNSANFLTGGAFGQGWSSILDMTIGPGLTDSSGNPVTEAISYPDGTRVAFGVDAASYVPPQGRFATLAYQSAPAGFTLTDKNDTVYAFTQLLSGTGSAGSYGLTSVTDALGNSQTFTWSGGHVARMTAGAYSPPAVPCASCRALQVDCATPAGARAAHVSDVMPIINGTASTSQEWTYAYNGDQLAGVCDPLSSLPCTGQSACPASAGGCTAYAYTAGSDYQNALLTTGPASYWPLSDSTGTARSAVLVNEGTDNGTYSAGVLAGQPGGLAGSTATSALFGTNSYV